MTPPAPPQRVLLVSLRYLGDGLLSTPLARAMRRRWPQCSVDMLVFAGTEGMFEGNPDIAQVIAVPEAAPAADTLRRVRALWNTYDLAVVGQTGTRPFLFGWAAARRAVGLVGADRRKSWWKQALFDRSAVLDEHAPRVLQNQRVAELLGIDEPPVVVPPSAGWAAADISRVLDFDVSRERFAVVHPSPRRRYKQWTGEGWQALIRALAAQGLRVVVTSGPGASERGYLDGVLRGLPASLARRIEDPWTLAQTADVLRLASLYVGPDTATTHLAAACGTPTVALFGPTDPVIWGPWPVRDGAPYARVAAQQRRGNVLLLQNPDLACVPCQLEGCDRHRDSHSECLDRLPAERVIEAGALLLKDARRT
jgi:heptosyltransferase-3